MRTMTTPLATAVLLLWYAAGCAAGPPGSGGCNSDSECKGDRVCERGVCVSPPAVPAKRVEQGDEPAAVKGDPNDKPDKEAPPGPANESERFRDETNGFSMRFPEGWELQRNTMGTVLIAFAPNAANPGGFRENVNVVTEQLPPEMDIEDYRSANMATMKKLLTDFTPGESGEATFGEVPARWLTYSHRMGELDLEVLVYMTVSVPPGRGFVITATCQKGMLERFRKQFDDVIRSFRLEK